MVPCAAAEAPRVVIGARAVEGAVEVAVRDNGPGISDEDQAHIFEKFYVGSNHQGSSTGLGLGLYIARQMIELHDGRIWVESQIGEGSTFCFQVPKKVRGQP